MKSENPPGDTSVIVDYICNFLDALGIRCNTTTNSGGRCNIYTKNRDSSLLLCGHLDVVPAIDDGWTHEPFSGEDTGSYIWGRGSTDMKGGCAAILTAIANLIENAEEPVADLAFVCDEETGGEYGMRYLLAKNILRPCDCLIAEPTPFMNPCIGQKGLCRVKLNFKGEPGHGSLYPYVGMSAIMEAYGLIAYLNSLNKRVFNVDDEMEDIFLASSQVLTQIFGIGHISDALRKITYNPGRISGGEEINIVAQECSMDLEMRVPWGCNTERLVADIAKHAPKAKLTTLDVAAPTFTSPASGIVRTTCAEIARVYQSEAQPIVQWAASDARFLRKSGFDVLEYGPGEIMTIHGIDERVSVSNLEKAVDVYQGIIRRYSNGPVV